RTWDGNLVRIPNEKLFNSVIENKVSNEIRRVEVVVGIAYKEEVEHAINVIKKVVEDHRYVIVEPAPLIFVNELGDSSVNLTIKVWAPNNYAYQTQIELLKLIKQALDKEGIEIPFPQRDIWIRKK
ncbi:MAG TPA: mechanosensitive ion channel family protein, partial [Thermoplasmata archaeon]|nr:mechanosensitive ion channel family protein [Thermoplasmata archaeon]